MGLDDKNSGSKVKNLSVPVFLGPLTTTKQEIGSIGLKSQIWISASMKCTGRNIRFFFKIGAGIAWHLCQSLNAILATVITIFIQFGPFFCMGSASCFESLLSLFCWWPLLGQVAIWPPNWPQIWKSMQVCHVGYQSRAHDTLDWFKLCLGLKVVSGGHDGHLATFMATKLTANMKINASMPCGVSISSTWHPWLI